MVKELGRDVGRSVLVPLVVMPGILSKIAENQLTDGSKRHGKWASYRIVMKKYNSGDC